MDLVVRFEKDKETPGTVRYAEVTEEERGKIGTLYIRKDVVEELGLGDAVSVTVKADLPA